MTAGKGEGLLSLPRWRGTAPRSLNHAAAAQVFYDLGNGTSICLANPHDAHSEWEMRSNGDLIRGHEKPISTTSESIVATENAALNRERTNEARMLLWHGAFIIERLYLEQVPVLEEAGCDAADVAAFYDAAARLARFLLRYWTREAATGDDLRAKRALPMLHRTYWRALVGVVQAAEAQWAAHSGGVPAADQSLEQAFGLLANLAEPDDAWLRDWLLTQNLDLKEEYVRALHDWQGVCISDTYAWFFIQVLCPWNGKPESNWQQLREEELGRTVWSETSSSNAAPSSRELRMLGFDTSEGSERIKFLIDEWFLPRYDLRSVSALRFAVDQRTHRLGPVARVLDKTWRSLEPYGILRFWAGILVGYLVTMFQSDTWKLFSALATNRPGWGFAYVVLILAMIVGYLFLGIRHRVGLRNPKSMVWRVWGVLIRGELFAILAGISIMLIIGPVFMSDLGLRWLWQWRPLDIVHPIGIGWGAWWRVIFLYSQTALFIGVFAQLIFDERPATTPLPAP